MESTKNTLLKRVADYLADSGVSERQFGLEVNGDHKLVARLRDGKATLATIEKIEARISAHEAAA